VEVTGSGVLAVANLGRSAGYTLRPEGFGIAFCIAEEVMDELFGPPFIGSPERERWEAVLRARSTLRPGKVAVTYLAAL
jgi:hypothetical protein